MVFFYHDPLLENLEPYINHQMHNRCFLSVTSITIASSLLSMAHYNRHQKQRKSYVRFLSASSIWHMWQGHACWDQRKCVNKHGLRGSVIKWLLCVPGTCACICKLSLLELGGHRDRVYICIYCMYMCECGLSVKKSKRQTFVCTWTTMLWLWVKRNQRDKSNLCVCIQASVVWVWRD